MRYLAWASVAVALLAAGDSVARPRAARPRAAAVPTLCRGTSTAERVVDKFWATLDRGYALFDIRLPNGNWDDIGADACDRAAKLAEGDGNGLFDLLWGLAKLFNDGHIQLTALDLGRKEDGGTPYRYEKEIKSVEGVVESRYLDAPLGHGANNKIAWGFKGKIGYLSITGMDGLSMTGDEDDDRAEAGAAMDAALMDLGSMNALIVDVRANEGGWDTVSLDIAARFAGKGMVAWWKQLRNGPGHTDFGAKQPSEVADGPKDAFAGDVVLLTSGGTFSAAETFALAMRVRDHVTLMGERSAGHFSDLTDGTLPNGWSFTYSGERYTAADGVIYETLGVPVAEEVHFDPAALAAGRDVMFEAALAHLSH